MSTSADPSTVDPLALLGVSGSAARLLRYFTLHPQSTAHARQLQRQLRLGSASVQRDLERMVVLGALERITQGRVVQFRPVTTSTLWQAVRLLIAEYDDPAALLRDALCDVQGIEAAFVFGSTANGTARPDSDIDLFVVETPDIDRRALHRQLFEVGLLLNREVNAVRYTTQALAERLGQPNHAGGRFILNTLEGPKRLVAGTVAAILPLVTAAGLQFTDHLALSS